MSLFLTSAAPAEPSAEKPGKLPALEAQVDSARKERNMAQKALKEAQKANPSGDHAALEENLNRAKKNFRAKNKELNAYKVGLGKNVDGSKKKTEPKSKPEKKAENKAKSEKKAKNKAKSQPSAKKQTPTKPAVSGKMEEPGDWKIKFPGDLSLKDGTVLKKVTVLQMSPTHLRISDSESAERTLAVSDLAPASRKKLGL